MRVILKRKTALKTGLCQGFSSEDCYRKALVLKLYPRLFLYYPIIILYISYIILLYPILSTGITGEALKNQWRSLQRSRRDNEAEDLHGGGVPVTRSHGHSQLLRGGPTELGHSLLLFPIFHIPPA